VEDQVANIIVYSKNFKTGFSRGHREEIELYNLDNESKLGQFSMVSKPFVFVTAQLNLNWSWSLT
jgi:hypothetical protein